MQPYLCDSERKWLNILGVPSLLRMPLSLFAKREAATREQFARIHLSRDVKNGSINTSSGY